ncbi:MAG: hypothetical protein F9K29_03425 [Hyphomicrobiaceae bacterium]|nr:MAG: hypothetical protein F9K29_03425 [Hyphomicrobiaceae bacterium]
MSIRPILTLPRKPHALLTLPIDRRARIWDPVKVLERVTARLVDDPAAVRRAFLNPDGQGLNRLLFADIDADNRLVINVVAVFRAAAAIFGGRVQLPPDVDARARAALTEFYRRRLGLPAPASSFTLEEFEALRASDREARLRGLGVSRSLAKKLCWSERPRSAATAREIAELLKAITSAAAPSARQPA